MTVSKTTQVWLKQTDMLRRLLDQLGHNKAAVVDAYAKAERDGLVGRKSNEHDETPESYAERLWANGHRKDRPWIQEYCVRHAIPMTTERQPGGLHKMTKAIPLPGPREIFVSVIDDIVLSHPAGSDPIHLSAGTYRAARRDGSKRHYDIFRLDERTGSYDERMTDGVLNDHEPYRIEIGCVGGLVSLLETKGISNK
jgi:hypothetical protein